ncbi:MAG: histidine kinase [Bacteroidales bacterium]|nr:histidine kinase [Bacteroidales bacterium]
MNKLYSYFFLLILFIPLVLRAHEQQNFVFKNFSTENSSLIKGLSQNSVRCILQDSKGFLWIGTWDGLNRYDGYDFVYYYEEDGLSNPTVNSLYEDDQGNMWIGTEAGLNVLDRHKNVIYDYWAVQDSGLVNDNITKIVGDTDGSIWIGTHKGLSHYDQSTKTFTAYLNGPKDGSWLRSNLINDIIVDQNALWLATPDGVMRFDKKTKTIKRLYLSSILKSDVENTTVNTMIRTDPNTLLLGTNNGFATLNSDTHLFSHKSFDDDIINQARIQAFYEDLHGDLWIGTDGLGLFVVDSGFHIHNFTHDSQNQNGIVSDKISCIYQDNNENIWIGSFKGLSLPHLGVLPFKYMTHSNTNLNSLSSDYVLSIVEDHNQNIWIASDNGLNKYNKQTQTYEHIFHDVGNPEGLVDNDLRCLLVDSGNKLWITTNNNGLSVYDIDKKNFKTIQNNPRQRLSLTTNQCHAVVEDHLGFIWISTANGLNKYDPSNDTIIHYFHDPHIAGTISDNWIWNLYIDKEGVLWCGSKAGLDRYDIETDSFSHISLEGNDQTCIDIKEVFVIFQDSKGIYWIGLRGGGLRLYNHQSKEVKCYSMAQGLPNNLIYSILEDDNHDMWISSNMGLSHFLRKTGGFVNYNVRDGILSNEFNLWSAYKDAEGYLYFGGMNGLNIFHPKNIEKQHVKTQTVVTGFYLKGQIVDKDVNHGDTINLNYSEDFFSFEFASIDFHSPLKKKYRYKIDNIDKDWVIVGPDNRHADYRDMKPGSYLFQVESSNSDGIWELEPVKVNIEIRPPWYGTWWFRLAGVFFSIGLGWYLVNLRIKQLRMTHDIENKMLKYEMSLTEARQQALRLQMNPHFIFNSLNSIQSFILKNNIDVAINYLAKFSQLMRSNLANARESYISVEDEVKSLKYYLEIEKLRFDDKFIYTFDVEEKIDAEFVGIPPMLIQPFIENAILHGIINKKGIGEIHIEMKQENDDTLLCVIRDNGVGRAEAAKIKENSGFKRKSRALNITKERLDLLSKQSGGSYSLKIVDLFDQSNLPTGTKVEIRVAFIEL